MGFEDEMYDDFDNKIQEQFVEKCFYCDQPAMYFDKVAKRGGFIKILRKKYDIKEGEPEEAFVCQTHYDIEVAKPVEKI